MKHFTIVSCAKNFVYNAFDIKTFALTRNLFTAKIAPSKKPKMWAKNILFVILDDFFALCGIYLVTIIIQNNFNYFLERV